LAPDPSLPSSVLILTNQLTTGGAEVYVLTVSSWLAARGVHTVLAAAPGELVDRIDEGVVYYPIPLKDIRAGLPLAALRVARLVRRHKPEIIVANSLVTAWVARLASLGQIPVVSVAHGWSAERYKIIAPPLAIANRVVPVSNEVKKRRVGGGLAEEKVHVVPNGVDLSPFGPRAPEQQRLARTAFCADDDSVIVTNIGRYVDQKQQEHIIEIARRLRDEVPELRYGIIGWGPREDHLRSLAKQAGVDDIVTFLVRRKDVPDLLMASDIYLCTSDWEGMPLSMIEAMAAGLPIISTDVEGMSALVRDENGVLCPVGDVGALTDAVRRLGRDEVGRLHRGGHSRALAEREFSKDVMCRRLACLLSEMVGRA
jgi:glycosyltransferase involved in cell wall biosynthesis